MKKIILCLGLLLPGPGAAALAQDATNETPLRAVYTQEFEENTWASPQELPRAPEEIDPAAATTAAKNLSSNCAFAGIAIMIIFLIIVGLGVWAALD